MSLLSMIIKKFRKEPAPNPKINIADAIEVNRSLDSKDMVVLDVRSPEEFSGPTGHIRNAINVPLQSLSERVHELAAYRNSKVVVVCLSDKRSTQAIHTLGQAGFEDLVLLRGGMMEWAANKLPVAVG